jgi:hypothetical protein
MSCYEGKGKELLVDNKKLPPQFIKVLTAATGDRGQELTAAQRLECSRASKNRSINGAHRKVPRGGALPAPLNIFGLLLAEIFAAM